jgi:hypothetical protein
MIVKLLTPENELTFPAAQASSSPRNNGKILGLAEKTLSQVNKGRNPTRKEHLVSPVDFLFNAKDRYRTDFPDTQTT